MTIDGEFLAKDVPVVKKSTESQLTSKLTHTHAE